MGDAVARFGRAVLAAAWLTAWPHGAHAEDPHDVAAREFRAGGEAYAHRDFRDAAEAFERAYRAQPRAAALYSAGLAWQGAGDLPRAADALAGALQAQDLAPDLRADAQPRLAWMRARLGRLQVNAPDGSTVSVAHLADAAPPVRTHLVPGRYTLAVRFSDGLATTQEVSLTSGTQTVVDVVEPAPPPQRTAAAPGSTVPAAPTQAGGGAQRLFGWIALGGAAAATGANIVVYELGSSARSDYERSGRTDVGLYDRANAYFTASKILWAVTGVLAATGVVLWLTAPRGAASSPSASLRLSPGGAAVEARF